MKAINLKTFFKAFKEFYAGDGTFSDYDKAREKVEKAIKEAEGKASARTLSTFAIGDALSEIEEKFAIPKKYMEGVAVSVDVNAQKFPNAYKHTPMSTVFSAVYHNGSWWLNNVSREPCRTPNARVIVCHTEESQNAIIARFTRFER